MLVQRTLPIAMPDTWNSGFDVLLDPGDAVDFRFIRAAYVLSNAGATDCAAAAVLHDAAGSVLGIWPSFAPAGGAGIGAGDTAHVMIDAGVPLKTLGSTSLGGTRFVQVSVPENLIVIGTQKQRMSLRLIGATAAVPVSFVFFTFAFDDGLDETGLPRRR